MHNKDCLWEIYDFELYFVCPNCGEEALFSLCGDVHSGNSKITGDVKCRGLRGCGAEFVVSIDLRVNITDKKQEQEA